MTDQPTPVAPPQGVIEVRENHKFDEVALDKYLRAHLPGYGGDLVIKQFEGGQSNPTFLLHTGGKKLVMRKKPPGTLLPTAHAIEREYRIYKALEDTAVPVPKTYFLCEDPSIIGTPFFVMDFVEGRVFRDTGMTSFTPEHRRAVYRDMARVLGALHSVDYKAKGLTDYGKPGNYFNRQITRWTDQYLKAKTHEIPSMNALLEWLPKNMPNDDTTTIVHGDFALYNLMWHPTEPRCVALLDWELSTLGHPMADLAYNCMRYYTPDAANFGEGTPTEDEFVSMYCEMTGRERIQGWNFYLAFGFFRLASIIQGVYKRGLDGNASSAHALSMKDVVTATADTGWHVAQNVK
jgi:aminoglycoside phosphotransferase (APT) family kinase protein